MSVQKKISKTAKGKLPLAVKNKIKSTKFDTIIFGKLLFMCRMKKIMVVAATVFMLIVCTAFALQSKEEKQQYINIIPAGEQIVTLEFGQSYEESGATAQYVCHGETVDIDVDVSKNVNTELVGSYLVKYSATYNEVTGTAYRRVNVVDSVPPEITLVSDPNRFTLPNQVYEEEGFIAKDNYDGDITDLVVRTENREKVFYTVTDSSGNSTTVERWIAYEDPEPPVLTLVGGESITVLAGNDFVDPGWSATDNCDGDLAGKVLVSGYVDIYMPGDYVLTYSVTDSYQNTTTVIRSVTVIPQTPRDVVVPSDKVIYLTFDDGPGPDTARLLDILARYNVKATFFVVNTKYIDIIKRAHDEGHAIGIHTTTHTFKEIYTSEEAFLNDLYTMRGIIRDVTGVTTTLMRFPGGSSNTVSRNYNRGIMTRLTQKVVELGFQYFDWNVDSDDAGRASSSYTVFNNVVEGVNGKQIAVVLQHDIKSYSVDAVERIINWGLSNGYTFLPLEPNSPGCHHPVNN